MSKAAITRSPASRALKYTATFANSDFTVVSLGLEAITKFSILSWSLTAHRTSTSKYPILVSVYPTNDALNATNNTGWTTKYSSYGSLDDNDRNFDDAYSEIRNSDLTGITFLAPLEQFYLPSVSSNTLIRSYPNNRLLFVTTRTLVWHLYFRADFDTVNFLFDFTVTNA